jgi:sugar phosphate isomerase/epimerase
MLLGIQERNIPGPTLKEKLRIIEDLGLQGIEFSGSMLWEREREIEDAISNSKIEISSICSGYRGNLLHTDPNERNLALQDIERILFLGGKWKCNGLIIIPRLFDKRAVPDLSPYINATDLEQNLFHVILDRIFENAQKYKCPIILEPLNRYLNDVVNTGVKAVEYIKDFNSPLMGIMLDFFHMNIEESSFDKAIQTTYQYLLHIHLADSNRLWPGEGQINWKNAFASLNKVNYNKFCVFECMVGIPTIDRLQKSLKYLRDCGF